jgi:hypothetical protein
MKATCVEKCVLKATHGTTINIAAYVKTALGNVKNSKKNPAGCSQSHHIPVIVAKKYVPAP